MKSPEPTTQADLTLCDREPIHAPSAVQPHGVLLALSEPDLRVIQASDSVTALFGHTVAGVLGRPISDLLGADQFDPVRDPELVPAHSEPVLLRAVRVRGRVLNAVAHRADGVFVLELEPGTHGTAAASHVPPIVARFIAQVQGVTEVSELGRLAAAEVRALTGFDRVLVYRFDPDGTGVVVAEDGSGRLPSYLDHRFPAADIPAPARELYRRNRLRLIPDAGYRPARLVPPLNPLTGRPLDLSFATLRSVAPVHVEYMRNMGTAASMSVSVLTDGALWGLIACHHRDPRSVPFQVRTACDVLAQVLALQIAARERAAGYERRAATQSRLTRLLAHMSAAEDYRAGLLDHPDELLAFVGAGGAAVVGEARIGLVGRTPSVEQVRALADWLFREVRREVYHTDALGAAFRPAGEYAASASGLLAVAVSKLHPTMILWFRPEVVETIRWGGDPRKEPGTAPADSSGRLNPRRSFETWSETVRGRAAPWLPGELEGAAELRNAVVGVVLRKAEELAALNDELQRSNRELEAFSYSVSHDLRAPLRHIVGYAELLKEVAQGKLGPAELKHADTIIESSVYAGKLVDNLLAYSRMSRAALERNRIDMTALVREVRRDVMGDFPDRRVRWDVGPLPAVEGDLMMLKLAVRNLLANAVKYTKPRAEAVIEIGCRPDPTGYVFHVRDNGVGFDMRYADKLFGVFQRLHRWEDFEGTGIGLANVRRIVERHGGRTWAEGAVDRGATFHFSLPVPANRDHNNEGT